MSRPEVVMIALKFNLCELLLIPGKMTMMAAAWLLWRKFIQKLSSHFV